MCGYVTDHRTFIEDYLKVLDFMEWFKEFYPEKAKFLTNKSQYHMENQSRTKFYSFSCVIVRNFPRINGIISAAPIPIRIKATMRIKELNPNLTSSASSATF